MVGRVVILFFSNTRNEYSLRCSDNEVYVSRTNYLGVFW
nr:MAG TPA: hypothetical protein [Caudoviricetes sp.]